MFFQSMRIGIIVLVGLWVGAGCQTKQPTLTGSVVETVQEKKIEIPAELPRTSLGLIHDGLVVRVGSTPEEGFKAFNKEEKALAINELPPDWPKDLRGTGWSGDRFGFGMIMKEGRLVGALYTEKSINEQRLKEILDDYKHSYGDPQHTIDSPDVRYWFWMDETSSCVICATKNSRGELVVAIGTGLLSIMEALKMSPETAQLDKIAAETLLRNRATGTPKKE